MKTSLFTAALITMMALPTFAKDWSDQLLPKSKIMAMINAGQLTANQVAEVSPEQFQRLQETSLIHQASLETSSAAFVHAVCAGDVCLLKGPGDDEFIRY